MTDKGIKFVICVLLIQLFLIGFFVWNNYQGRVDIANNSQAGCERSKKDRKDNADFQTAHSNYIFKVTGAASVKEDVKRAAREARKTFTRTSASLAKRSMIDCQKAFPDVEFP